MAIAFAISAAICFISGALLGLSLLAEAGSRPHERGNSATVAVLGITSLAVFILSAATSVGLLGFALVNFLTRGAT